MLKAEGPEWCLPRLAVPSHPQVGWVWSGVDADPADKDAPAASGFLGP